MGGEFALETCLDLCPQRLLVAQIQINPKFSKQQFYKLIETAAGKGDMVWKVLRAADHRGVSVVESLRFCFL